MADVLGSLTAPFFTSRRKEPVDRRRSLALKPLRNPHVPWKPQDDPAAPVTIEIPLQRRAVPKPLVWIATKLARQEPPSVRRLQLDPVGSFVWRIADGTLTVRELIWKLAAAYKLNRRDAEVALLEFLGKLSARNLLGFANIPEQTA
ncbi:MAG: PqqD family peptide modification chaperone [Planctomycetota bacterium]|jgi:hypothetical protein